MRRELIHWLELTGVLALLSYTAALVLMLIGFIQKRHLRAGHRQRCPACGDAEGTENGVH